MITKRLFLSGIVTTAAVATASQYLPTVIEQRQYATVYGVGWDFEVIEHPIWQPMSVAYFGGTPAIDQFREVTDFVHAFPVDPLPVNINRNFHTDPVDPLDRFRWNPTFGLPFTNKAGGEWDGKSTKYFTADMENRVVWNRDPDDIWYFDRAAKEDLKPYRAEYDYWTHSRKLGRGEA